MAAQPYLLAIDQGTTSTRAILFDKDCAPLTTAQIELRQSFPRDGWVEHDPEEIWSATQDVCRQVLAAGGVTAADIAGIGITNQRETTVPVGAFHGSGDPQGDRLAGPSDREFLSKADR